MSQNFTESEMRVFAAFLGKSEMKRGELALAAHLDQQESEDVMVGLTNSGFLHFNSMTVSLEAPGRNVVREIRRLLDQKKNEDLLRGR